MPTARERKAAKARDAAELAAKLAAAQGPIPTAKDRRKEMREEMRQLNEMLANEDGSSLPSVEGFIPMASFDGARPGFVFKRDVAGTGYYPDKTDSSGSLHTAVPSCHYDVLGVAMDASEAEVRQAYRKRALQYHPDRSDSAGATALFQAVQASYAVLSDPDERAFYDRNRDAILASRKPKRETAGSWSSKAWTRTVDDTDIAAPEPDGVSLWPLFSPLAYPAGVADGPNGFYSAMGAAFAEVGAEEDELLRARGEAPNERPLPPFGTAESMGDAVEAFYTRWARFETCRTGAGAERHGLSQIAKAATKQQRGAMTAENERLKAESRRARTECVRALVAYARKRDPRVGRARAAGEGAATTATRRQEARIKQLEDELAALAAEEAAEGDDDGEDGGGEEDALGALLEECVTLGLMGAGEADQLTEQVARGEASEAALVTAWASRAEAARPARARGDETDSDEEEDGDDDDEDALLRLAGLSTAARKASAQEEEEEDDDDDDEPLPPPPRAPLLPPAPPPKGKGPKKKERDPEAAAKAKEGMVMARAIAGLACKVCGATFPNRQVLLKHINKTGHLRDPNEMNLPEGMFYIPDMSDKPGLLR